MRWRAVLLALLLAVAIKSPAQAQGTPPPTAAAIIFNALSGAVTGYQIGGLPGAGLAASAGVLASFGSYVKEKFGNSDYPAVYNFVATVGVGLGAVAGVFLTAEGYLSPANWTEMLSGVGPPVLQEFFNNQASGLPAAGWSALFSGASTALTLGLAGAFSWPVVLTTAAIGGIASLVDSYLHGNPQVTGLANMFGAAPPPPPPPGVLSKLSLLFPQILSPMVVPPAPNAAPVPAKPDPATPVPVSSDGLCHYSDGSFDYPGAEYAANNAPCAPMLCDTSDGFQVNPYDLSETVKGQCNTGETPTYLTSAPADTAPQHDVAARSNLILRPNLIHPVHPAVPPPPPPPPIPGAVVLKHHDQHPASVEHTTPPPPIPGAVVVKHHDEHPASVEHTPPQPHRFGAIHNTSRTPSSHTTTRQVHTSYHPAHSNHHVAQRSSRQHVGGGGGSHRSVGGGRRRSDIRLKEDIVVIGRLDNGIGLYRFRYRGGDRTLYVGVMAQEVQRVAPAAVTRGRDGSLRVDYDMLGLPFMTWEEWRMHGGAVSPGAQ